MFLILLLCCTTSKEVTGNANELFTENDYNMGKELFLNNSCVACHKINERSVGPAFREVATRYEKVSKTIIDKLSIKIQNGSIDSWGKIPMPPNLLLSKEERVTIIKFILLTKYKS